MGSLQDLGADQFEVVEMLLEQLEVLLEVEEAHVHQVKHVRLVFLIELLLLHCGQVSDFLHLSWVDCGNFEVALLFFVNDFLNQGAAFSWLAINLIVVERFNESLAFLLKEHILVGWLWCSLELLVWNFGFDHWAWSTNFWKLDLILVDISLDFEVV